MFIKLPHNSYVRMWRHIRASRPARMFQVSRFVLAHTRELKKKVIHLDNYDKYNN